MSYKLLPVSGFALQEEERIIDYAFISEENFLLVVLLTSQAKLIVLYKAGGSVRLEPFLIAKYLPQLKSFTYAPILVAITSDASVIVIALSNTDIVLLPLKCLMQLSWGKTSAIVQKPVKFSIHSAKLDESFSEQYRPSSMFCFDADNGASCLVLGEKFGRISIIDLNLRVLSAHLECADGIQNLHSYTNLTGKYIMATTNTDSQFVIPLELKGISVRETLSRVILSELIDLSKNQSVQYFSQNIRSSNGGSLTAILEKETSFVTIEDSNSSSKMVYECRFSSTDCRLIQYTPRTIMVVSGASCGVCVYYHFLPILQSDEQSTFCMVENRDANESSKIFAILPLQNSRENELEECLLISSTDIHWLRPQRDIFTIVADCLAQKLFYSASRFCAIAQKLGFDSSALFENLLETVLKAENKLVYDLDGFVFLGLELNLDISEIMEILSRHNEADVLLPFLLIRCEKDPLDSVLRQLLFNAYMCKLRKLNNVNNNNCLTVEDASSKLCKKREALEEEIKHFIIKFNNSSTTAEVLSILLKHSLWSCVAVVLSQDTSRNSLVVVRYLAELSSWRDISKVDDFLKCLSLLEWPSGDSIGQILVTKMIGLLPYLSSTWQLQVFLDIADALLKRSCDFAMAIYFISAICLLGSVVAQRLNSEQNEMSHKAELQNIPKIACASNCSAAVADDGNVAFWGEFSASSLRLANDARKRKKIPQASPKRLAENYSPTSAQSSSTHSSRGNKVPKLIGEQESSELPDVKASSSCVTVPKIISLPSKQSAQIKARNESLNHKIVSVACGTEHVILLTADGIMLSWGRNRYGQCGNGTKNRITEPLLIEPGEEDKNFGYVNAIYAGHYHSALINNHNEVWLWGWGMYGQLSTGDNADRHVPTKILSLCGIGVTNVCLGYAHSLFHLRDGSIWGCGATANGQVGASPTEIADLVEKSRSDLHNKSCLMENETSGKLNFYQKTNGELKVFGLIKLAFPMPASLISSKYFHGIAICPTRINFGDFSGENSHRSTKFFENDAIKNDHLSEAISEKSDLLLDTGVEADMHTSVIYEWGECPQTVRMRTFLMQRLRSGQRREKQLSDDRKQLGNELASDTHEGENDVRKILEILLGVTNEALDAFCDQPSTPQSDKKIDYTNNGKSTSDKACNEATMNQQLQDHLKIRRCCVWRGAAIAQLSVGFNHAAFITSLGELYTWGRALEMQLGHGDKKDKDVPTRVLGPSNKTVKWKHVECARNFTVAVSTEGHVYVWGRNDKNQLGLGASATGKPGTSSKVRRIAFKPKSSNSVSSVTKYVDLPSNSTNVGAVTRLFGVDVFVSKVQIPEKIIRGIQDKLTCADQYTLNTVSRFFIKNPLSVPNLGSMPQSSTEFLPHADELLVFHLVFCVAEMHLFSGDLLHAVDVLSEISLKLDEYRRVDSSQNSKSDNRNEKNIVGSRTMECNGRDKFSHDKNNTNSTSTSGGSSRSSITQSHKSAHDAQNSITNNKTLIISSANTDESSILDAIDKFDALIDRVWNLVRAHPQRDIQSAAVLIMLRERFPIYHRLSADTRLCRMIDGYVDDSRLLANGNHQPAPFGSPISRSMSSPPPKLSELGIRERYAYVKRTKLATFLVTPTQQARLRALRQKCDLAASSQSNRLRFYADCCHYERCVVESGATKLKFAALRNRLRKCSQCVTRSRYMAITPSSKISNVGSK